MELIRGLHNVSARHSGNAVTIGNFDGVHLGHQAMLAALREQAATLAVPSLVMCFEPQPQEFFVGDQAPGRLMTWRDKVEAIAECGVDRVLLVGFDERFRAYTAQSFISDLLVGVLDSRHVMVGDDFRFGCDRRGDHNLLVEAGQVQGFSVGQMPTVIVAGTRVSSSRLRTAVATGDFSLAERLAGRDFSVSGHVLHGDKLGRTLGFPTANLLMRRRVLPLRGVYAVSVDGLGDEALPGVANVGSRPTVQGVQARCEVHLLDYAGDLYGRRIRVRFQHKLRDEQRFPSLDALKTAIAADVQAARNYFAV